MIDDDFKSNFIFPILFTAQFVPRLSRIGWCVYVYIHLVVVVLSAMEQ